MRIGLMSDSHGKTRLLERAIEIVLGLKAEAIVHCGDICSMESLRLLRGAGVPAWLVAGNMDRDMRHRLDASAQGSTVTYWHSTVEVPIENDTYLIATHGDNEDLLAELIRGEQFPYICHGHTHHARDVRQGQTRIICPGALAGPRHPHFPTVALLDTVADTVEFYDVAQPDRPIGISE
ncbi:MAG: metallophosphoesterase family protein [Verrucomicrobia bacterium]|jgi:uncharacterized protein|nr:metallophosphoesterase family protein [Verrucomicrobiota bacterium]MBT7065064.1 metallophosphoesterase family protein [Verrucomicrobiota bacterium]MBT7699591.1 metallophosphoesterase family protein [Verrucomicrobiota bacterium]